MCNVILKVYKIFIYFRCIGIDISIEKSLTTIDSWNNYKWNTLEISLKRFSCFYVHSIVKCGYAYWYMYLINIWLSAYLPKLKKKISQRALTKKCLRLISNVFHLCLLQELILVRDCSIVSMVAGCIKPSTSCKR